MITMNLQFFGGRGATSSLGGRGGRGASNGGGSGNSSGGAKGSIQECKTFDELTATLKAKYGDQFVIDERLKDLKFEEVRDAISGADFILNEFGATDKLTGFDVGNSGVMCASFGGKISFTESYFKQGASDLSTVMNGGTYHPKNQNAYSTGAHEAGHILESWIAKQQSDNYFEQINAWNKNTVSTKIINEASKVVKKQYKARGEEAPSINALCHRVSGYASKNRSEAFAECMADYVANGKNANPLSIAVWNETKKICGKQ